MSKILYKLVKNNNSKSAAYGKWYARAVSKETLTFREFIEHVISHGSVYDRGTVTGILTQMLDCLKELMLDSKKVKFGEFGTFYASIRSVQRRRAHHGCVHAIPARPQRGQRLHHAPQVSTVQVNRRNGER